MYTYIHSQVRTPQPPEIWSPRADAEREPHAEKVGCEIILLLSLYHYLIIYPIIIINHNPIILLLLYYYPPLLSPPWINKPPPLIKSRAPRPGLFDSK